MVSLTSYLLIGTFFGALPFTLQLLRSRLNREVNFTTSFLCVKVIEDKITDVFRISLWRTPASKFAYLSGMSQLFYVVNDLRNRKCFELTLWLYSKSSNNKCQGQFVRCPGHSIHSGYQEYIRLVLLLSNRQFSLERSAELESWTPY